MKEEAPQEAAEGGKIMRLDEAQLREHLDLKITGSVEEPLNKLLDAEADRLCGADCYERSLKHVDRDMGRFAELTTVPTQADQVTRINIGQLFILTLPRSTLAPTAGLYFLLLSQPQQPPHLPAPQN